MMSSIELSLSTSDAVADVIQFVSDAIDETTTKRNNL
jgi:hypothetical protein